MSKVFAGILVIAALVAISNAAPADTTVVYKVQQLAGVEDRMRDGDKPKEGEVVGYYTDDKARLNDPEGLLGMPGHAMIYRLDKDVIWIIDDKTKTCEEITLEEAKQLGKIASPELSVKKTDKVEEVEGRKCVVFETTIESSRPRLSETATIWATDEIDIDDATKEFLDSAVKKFEGTGILQARFKALQSIAAADMFPVKEMTRISLMGRTRRTLRTLKSVSTDKLDDKLFEIPEGYTKNEPRDAGPVEKKPE